MKYGEIIGTGATATVYEWEEGKALKFFHHGYAKEDVEKEFYNAKAISDMNFATPKVYGIISCEGRMGIVYGGAKGESLLDWVLRTGDIQGCAMHTANLHKAIFQNKITDVQNYKEFLKCNILNVPSAKSKEQEAALQMLNKLKDGDTLCHGDFHPGNILISNGHTTIIDFMNVCHGDFLYDVARTVFLVEYTPVSAELGDKKMLLKLKKTLANLYLLEMDVTRERVEDYLSVIIAARVGECPDE